MKVKVNNNNNDLAPFSDSVMAVSYFKDKHCSKSRILITA